MYESKAIPIPGREQREYLPRAFAEIDHEIDSLYKITEIISEHLAMVLLPDGQQNPTASANISPPVILPLVGEINFRSNRLNQLVLQLEELNRRIGL